MDKLNYLYVKYKYSDKIKLLRMIAVIIIAIACFILGSNRIFYFNPDAGEGFRGFTWVVLAVGTVIVVVVGFLEIYRDLDISRLYMIIAITFGLLYIVIIPANETPDEKAHFHSAYIIADNILGIDGNDEVGLDGKGMMILIRDARTVDAEFPSSNAPDSIDTSPYEQYIESLAPATDEELSVTRSLWRMSDNGWIMYYIPAIGVAIGKALSLNFGWVYAFGVIFNLLFYVLMTTYAIRKIPFGKQMLFVISLLPITLQQVSSFSYDCGTFACCMVVIAQAFYLKYGDRSTRRDWKWNIEIPIIKTSVTELLMYIFCFVLLLNVKRGVYAILFLLPIALCVNKNWFRGRALKFTVSIIVLVMLGAVAYIFFFGGLEWIVGFLYDVPHDIKTTVGVDGLAPIEYFRNPTRFFVLTGNFLKHSVTGLFAQIGGGVLGYYRIFMSKKVVLVNLFMLFLSMIRYNKEDDTFRVGNRVAAFLVASIPIIITYIAMMLYWTYPWEDSIQGFQGRYIIPSLAILMLAVGRWKKLRIPNVDNLFAIIMTISSFLGCISILDFV